MAWRVVSISNRAKLDFKLNYMEVRQGCEFHRIHIGEISTLIIESTAVAITSYLLNELIKRKINIIICDERHLPSATVNSIYGSSDTSEKIKKQIGWSNDIKQKVWKEIIKEKILNQNQVLIKLGYKEESSLLDGYSEQIELGDKTNREGHAAKVYFNALLGKNVSRKDDCNINIALNYGYAIVLAALSRAIVSNGCITQIGVCHRGVFNNMNFSSDLLEPFRAVVDLTVFSNDFNRFESDEKRILKNILNQEFFFDNRKQFLSNIIPAYTKSIIDSLNNNDSSCIKEFLI